MVAKLNVFLMAAVAVWHGSPSPAGASGDILLIDQSNAIGGQITTGALEPLESLSQSFTPSLPGIDFFEVSMRTRSRTVAQVRLLSGETTVGAVLGSSPEGDDYEHVVRAGELSFPFARGADARRPVHGAN